MPSSPTGIRTLATAAAVRFRSQIPNPPLSYPNSPSHQDIADLILRQGSPSLALDTFRWASRLPSFRHGRATHRALVRSLVGFRRFDDARTFILDEIPRSTGSPPDDDTLVAFVRGLGRARRPREAIKALDLAAARFGKKTFSVRVLNSVLDALVVEDIDLARAFYRKKMTPFGVRGDERTFGILMKGLCRTNRIDEGFRLLGLAKAAGFGMNPVIYNSLIHALCRNGNVGRGRSLMGEMESPSEVTFNILISAYCAQGDLVKALVMLEECFGLGLVPDAISVTKVLDLLCKEGRVMEAVEVVERVEKKGGVLDVVCYNTLIEGFCRIGKPKVGRKLVKEMEVRGRILPNTQTYNLLMSGLCSAGQLDSTIDLFREMKAVGVDPDFETFNTIIRGSCEVGRMSEGFRFLEMMEEHKEWAGNRIEPYNSILYGLYKGNRLDEAQGFLGRMINSFPRAVDRSLMILGLCGQGQVTEAKKVYDQLVGEGGIPNMLVYACLIDGFCKANDLREAFDLINEMVARGYSPVVSMYNLLIDGFCRGGAVGSACKLLEEMVGRGCSPDAMSYGIVIGALCKGGMRRRAGGLVDEMVGKGLVPDHFVWNGLVRDVEIVETVGFDCLIQSGSEVDCTSGS